MFIVGLSACESLSYYYSGNIREMSGKLEQGILYCTYRTYLLKRSGDLTRTDFTLIVERCECLLKLCLSQKRCILVTVGKVLLNLFAWCFIVGRAKNLEHQCKSRKASLIRNVSIAISGLSIN
jgi:hypothetical protein